MTYSKTSLLTSVEFRSLGQSSWMRHTNGLGPLGDTYEFRIYIFPYLLVHAYTFLVFVVNFQCLLVKGWKGSSWSFPRGKKSKDEEDHACAVREVSFDSFTFLVSCVVHLFCTFAAKLISPVVNHKCIFKRNPVLLA